MLMTRLADHKHKETSTHIIAGERSSEASYGTMQPNCQWYGVSCS